MSGFLSKENKRAASQSLRADRIRVRKLVEHRDEEADRDHALARRPGWEMRMQKVLVRGAEAERALEQIASLLEAGVPIMKALQLAARLSPHFVKRSLYCTANRLAGRRRTPRHHARRDALSRARDA